MTSVAVKLLTYEAEEALNDDFGAHDLGKISVGRLHGRHATHWSVYAAGIGAVVGVVATVAGYILLSTPLIALGAGLFLTNAVGFYQLRKFAELQRLKDYVAILTKRVNDMGQIILGYHHANNNLKNISKDFGKELEEAQCFAKKAKKELEQKIAELKEVKGQLEKVEEKLWIVEKMYEKLKKAADQVTTEVTQFNDENIKFHKDLGVLVNKVAEARHIEEQFDEGLEHLEEQNADFANRNRELSKTVGELRHQVTMTQKLYEKLKEERQLLQEEVKNLGKIEGQVVEEASQVRQAGKEINEAAKALDKNLERLETVKDIGDMASLLRPLLEDLAHQQEEQSEEIPN